MDTDTVKSIYLICMFIIALLFVNYYLFMAYKHLKLTKTKERFVHNAFTFITVIMMMGIVAIILMVCC